VFCVSCGALCTDEIVVCWAIAVEREPLTACLNRAAPFGWTVITIDVLHRTRDALALYSDHCAEKQK